RRRGFEVNAKSRIMRVSFGGGYTFLNATYESNELVNGSSNSTNEEAEAGTPGLEGVIQIDPGNRIPLTPRHMVKAFADAHLTSKVNVDLGMSAFSSSFARGNENNRHEPDGLYYLGPGTAPGYAVFELGGRYQVHPRLEFFAQVSNLF